MDLPEDNGQALDCEPNKSRLSMIAFAQKPKVAQQVKPAESVRANPALAGERPNNMHSFLRIPRKIGNQAAKRRLWTDSEDLEVGSSVTAANRFVHDYSHIPVCATTSIRFQPKLMASAPGDIYERGADCVAEQVMRPPEAQLQYAGACGGGYPNGQPCTGSFSPHPPIIT